VVVIAEKAAPAMFDLCREQEQEQERFQCVFVLSQFDDDDVFISMQLLRPLNFCKKFKFTSFCFFNKI